MLAVAFHQQTRERQLGLVPPSRLVFRFVLKIFPPSFASCVNFIDVKSASVVPSTFDGTGATPDENSKQLINQAEAVLAVVSSEYLRRAVVGKNYIAMEVSAMHDRAKDIPIVPLGVDLRSDLQKVENWAWRQMNENWQVNPPVISEDFPLRNASEEILRSELKAALKAVEEWTKKP